MTRKTPDATALETCSLNNWPAPQRALDSDYNAPCWLCYEDAGAAIVVYLDEADCVVSCGNRAGRFIPQT